MKRTHLCLTTLVVLGARPALGEDLDAPDPTRGEQPQGYVYEHEHFSMLFGGGVLLDYATYDRDEESQQQMMLHPESGIRDLRGLVSGRLIWPRLSYTLGYMLDVADNSWRFRQTGIKIQFPEAGGYLFVGRTKEGFSTNKLMVGYYGWMNERAAANDAFLPILNDGARWTAAVFGGSLVYNVGAYADPVGGREKYNRNDWVFAGRAVWLPMGGDSSKGVLHLAGEARYAAANEGQLVFRSKPESFFAQSQAVDTGLFDASRSTLIGAEVYYAKGPLTAGGEYFLNLVDSDATGDPFFHGGEAFVAYMLTGEAHPYVANNAVFTSVAPRKSFFDGGWGAWELVVRGSYVDLDSEVIEGGKFARVSGLVNWYLTDSLRVEAVYGYGVLDRMGMTGGLQFFQTRIQLSIK